MAHSGCVRVRGGPADACAANVNNAKKRRGRPMAMCLSVAFLVSLYVSMALPTGPPNAAVAWINTTKPQTTNLESRAMHCGVDGA